MSNRQLWQFSQLNEDQSEALPLVSLLVRSPRFKDLPQQVSGEGKTHPRAVWIDLYTVNGDSLIGDPVMCTPQEAIVIMHKFSLPADVIAQVVPDEHELLAIKDGTQWRFDVASTTEES